MYWLRLLGTASLEGPSGPLSGPAVQRRRFALLAMLGVAGEKGWARDKLVGYLWPESSEGGARHRLSDSLYVLRQALGEEAVSATGDVLRLNPEVVSTDVAAFEEALEREDFEEAVGLYSGPLLDGFYLSGSGEWEHWLESERQRLAGQYGNALESLAQQAEQAGSHSRAVDWWRRLAVHDPYNSRVVVRLMQALVDSGDPANALQYAREHEILLKKELGTEPAAEVPALADRLRAVTRVSGEEATPVGEPQPSEASAVAEPAGKEWAPGVGVARHRFLTRRTAGRNLIVALVVVSGIAATGWLLLHDGASEPEDRKSVAVLPFTNVSADPENEYFSEGIADDIINRLSKIADLRVISRQSSVQYRRSEKSLRRIAEELDVATIVEGSVQRVGDRVRINAQLIDAATDEHLWAEQYNRQLTDVFAIQSEVAQEIAAALEARPTPAEKERIEQIPTQDLEAYDLYLRALNVPDCAANRLWCDQRIGLLRNAIFLDSTFALAYAELSMVHTATFSDAYDRSSQRLAMAKRAADRALELDPELAEGHSALGRYFDVGLRDRERAAVSYREALRRNPNEAMALWYKAGVLTRQGQAEEATAIHLDILARDPRNFSWTWRVARRFHYLHEFERSEQYYERAFNLPRTGMRRVVWRSLLYLAWSGDTTKAAATCGDLTWRLWDAAWRLCDEVQYERGMTFLSEALASQGRTSDVVGAQLLILKAWLYGRRGAAESERAAYDSARIILEPVVRELPDDAMMRSGLGITYAGLGRRDEAIREGRRAVELEPDEWILNTPSYILNLARIYMMLGEPDSAVEQLETLPTDRGLVTPAWLRADPLWEPLRDHPRFQALLGKYE